MEYYILSFIITFILFTILQIIEYRKNIHEINNNIHDYYIEPYNLFQVNNILLFIIIYIIFTVICFYMNTSNISFSLVSRNNKGGTISESIHNVQIKDEIDPRILSKINDNFNVGFEPFTSDIEDDVSTSSLLSNEDTE